MVRSAVALTAVLILSGFAAVQQEATHTVVTGDTLWDLAQHYYQNPFDWRRIWNANRDRITDPNLIEPGWVLTIPGREAEVSDVTVEAPPTQPPPPPAGSIRDERTIFYRDTASTRAGVVRSEQTSYLAVSRDLVYSAPWMVPLGEEPESLGTLDRLAGGANISTTPRGWNRVHLTFRGEAPSVGSQLLVFRVTKVIEDVGQVATPTGVVTIAEANGGEAVGIVTKEYFRMSLGDQLTTLPAYELRPGQAAREVMGGSEAMVMGFAGLAELHDVGAVAFLDLGGDQGVTVGDEFEYVNPQAGSGVVEGRLQVVGVKGSTSSARIVSMSDVVFQQGLVVRLARKMQ